MTLLQLLAIVSGALFGLSMSQLWIRASGDSTTRTWLAVAILAYVCAIVIMGAEA